MNKPPLLHAQTSCVLMNPSIWFLHFWWLSQPHLITGCFQKPPMILHEVPMILQVKKHIKTIKKNIWPMIFPCFFPWYSHDFPIIFQWFSHYFPMIFPWFSHDFPMIFPWFSHVFPMVFPMVFPRFSQLPRPPPHDPLRSRGFRGSGARVHAWTPLEPVRSLEPWPKHVEKNAGKDMS